MTKILALLAVLIAATPALAGNRYCGGYGCVSSYRVERIVEQPINETNIGQQFNLYQVAPDVRGYYLQPRIIASSKLAELRYGIQSLEDQAQALEGEQHECAAVCVVQPGAVAAAMPGAQQPDQYAMKAQQQQQQGSVVIQACGKCHGPNGSGQAKLDLTKWITCEDIEHANAAMESGKMPQGKKLSEAGRSAVLKELFAWNRLNNYQKPGPAAASAPPQSQPTPPQDPEPANQAPNEAPAELESYGFNNNLRRDIRGM